MQEIKGILPAVITPLDAGERFDRAAFQLLIGRLYEAGVHGLYVCGQTGEGMPQSPEQRMAVADAAVAASPGKHIIIHVGALSTAEAIGLARHAAHTGATAISSLPPLGVYSYEEIRSYYSRLAEASELPLLIYYYPSGFPAIRTLDQLFELCALPNVMGLKFTDSDLYKMSLVRQQGCVIFNGSDELLVAGLLMGADGGIGSMYNLIPDEFVRLYDLAVAGNWEEARRVQHSINSLIRIVLKFPAHAAIKALLTWSGIPCRTCIAPRAPLSALDESKLQYMISNTVYAERFSMSVAG